MKVYTDTDICRWAVAQVGLDDYKELLPGNPAVFHMPFPYDSGFDVKIKDAVNICSVVVVLVSELHEKSVQFIINNQHNKIKYFVCGAIKNYKFDYWMDWFITTKEFYLITNLLKHLDPYSVKLKYFDILLGWKKPHRDAVFNFINESNLNDQVVMTYFQDRSKTIDQQGIWNVDIPPNTLRTITRISHLGESLSLSQLIPVDIYNQTAYSIVAETNADNHYSFYTEKIVKPILGRRLFLVFSGQNYLKNLRDLGFKTFDGIVDETYDTVADLDQRNQLIIEQMKYLFNQDQRLILDKIKSIVDHNYNHMINTKWQEEFKSKFKLALTP